MIYETLVDLKFVYIVFNRCVLLVFRVHVVFGHVLSGQEVVSHIEGLPVDRTCRPLQDAKVTNCGELVLKMKTKGKLIIDHVERKVPKYENHKLRERKVKTLTRN